MSEPEDPNHRTFVNLVTAAFIIILAIAAIFVIKWLTESQKLERCLLSGRRDCIPIEAPPRP